MGKKIARHIIAISATFFLTTNNEMVADPIGDEAAKAFILATDEPPVLHQRGTI